MDFRHIEFDETLTSATIFFCLHHCWPLVANIFHWHYCVIIQFKAKMRSVFNEISRFITLAEKIKLNTTVSQMWLINFVNNVNFPFCRQFNWLKEVFRMNFTSSMNVHNNSINDSDEWGRISTNLALDDRFTFLSLIKKWLHRRETFNMEYQ